MHTCVFRFLRLFALPALLNLTACAAVHPRPPPDNAPAERQIHDAIELIAHKHFQQGESALRTAIEAKTFSSLPEETQYRALSTAGRAAMNHGQQQLGYGYLVRAAATSRAGFDDILAELRAAAALGHKADAARSLTSLAQRWPDRIKNLNSEFVAAVVRDTNQLPHGAALPLLRALYDAQWKLKWDIEPSSAWRDLSLLLLEKGLLPEAIEVSTHVTDVYVLVAMRADRRFDTVIAAHPAQFDIEAAADRDFRRLESASEKEPGSLELKSDVIEALIHERRYGAALGASDTVFEDIHSTNYPTKLFEDFDERYAWFLNDRSWALERMNRRDDALAQLATASVTFDSEGNISELINLGSLYCAVGRPHDALAAIGAIVTRTSPYGAMQVEGIRLDAAVQLGDHEQAARSLKYMYLHRADDPSSYQDALVVVNQLDRAAHQLVTRLRDKDQRQAALESVQTFAPAPATPWETELNARQREVIARKDVQAAIQKVGRIGSYPLEDDQE